MLKWVLNHIKDPYARLLKTDSLDQEESWIIDDVNPSFCKMVSLSKDQLLGKVITELLPELAWTIIQARTTVKYDIPRLSTRLFRKPFKLELEEEGEHLHVMWIRESYNPVWIKEGDETTQSKALKFRLSKTQEIGKIGDWYANLRTGEEYWSEEIFIMMGLEPGSFKPSLERFDECVHPDDAQRVRELNLQGVNGSEYEAEFRIVTPDQQVRWMHTLGKTEMDEAGAPKEVYGLMQDITDYKKIEEDLRFAKETAEKANHRKSIYLANMSHEIRIPLSGIAGMTDLLLKTPLTKEQRELADYIKYSSDSLIKLINDVLDFSKIESGKMELDEKPFDIKDLLRKLMKSFEFGAKAKGLDLFLDLKDELPDWVEGDPIRMSQILNNIVGNALKFTGKGSITVSADLLCASEETCTLRLDVTDTGVGITPERLEKIFDEYEQGGVDVTTQFGGTGLGLAISKKLAQMMGGSIEVNSVVGEGTTFSCIIEVGNAPIVVEPQEIPLVSIAEEGLLEGMRILIAEDNFINRLFLTKLLEEVHQCWITSVDNGIKALEVLKSEKFDCALMDGNLPGLNGTEVVKAFREYEIGQGIEKPNPEYMPIIALTAEALKGDEERYLEAGMDYYLTKPVVEDVLLKLLLKIADDGESASRELPCCDNQSYNLGRLNYIRPEEFHAFVKRMTNKEIAELLRAAIKEYPAKVSEAETALWKEDRDTFRKLVHALRGSLGYFGAEGLSSHVMDIEGKATVQELNHLSLRYRELKHELLLFVEDLKDLERYYSCQAGEESPYNAQ